MNKVIIIHPDCQHSLQTALVLQKKGCLCKYFTTVYLKKNSISAIISLLAPASIKKKFLKHKLNGLDDAKINMFCQKRMLALSLVSCFLSEGKINEYRGRIIDSFNKKCLSYCLKHDFDILISFDTLSGEYYKVLKEKGVKLILDMSAPCFKEMYMNFKADVVRNPNDSKVLSVYLDSDKVRRNLANCEKELATYDYFLTASTYTRDSLVKNGVDASKVLIVPYGLTQIRTEDKVAHEDFACTFVGSVTQQKGCHYIFRIAEKMPSVTFNLIGVYDNSYTKIPANCKLYGYLSFSEIKRVLQNTDLFLFLSLADGFGFAATEAMAYGIPVICSNCAGVRDLVGSSGWIVDPTDTSKVMEIITWCISSPGALRHRGELARKRVAGLEWNIYGEHLMDFINTI